MVTNVAKAGFWVPDVDRVFGIGDGQPALLDQAIWPPCCRARVASLPPSDRRRLDSGSECEHWSAPHSTVFEQLVGTCNPLRGKNLGDARRDRTAIIAANPLAHIGDS
jgi:hypothetical protein